MKVIIISLTITLLPSVTSLILNSDPDTESRREPIHNDIPLLRSIKNRATKREYHYERIPKQTEGAEDLLEQFHIRLKSFILDTLFDVFGFELHQEKLMNQLAYIESLVQMHRDPSRKVSAQLEFAEYMFEAMVDAANLLQLYKVDNGITQNIIYKTIQLNIKLLSLHNSRGSPDPTIENYAKTVTRSIRLLHAWGEIFFNSTETPLSLLLIFHIQFSEAKDELRELAGYMSG